MCLGFFHVQVFYYVFLVFNFFFFFFIFCINTLNYIMVIVVKNWVLAHQSFLFNVGPMIRRRVEARRSPKEICCSPKAQDRYAAVSLKLSYHLRCWVRDSLVKWRAAIGFALLMWTLSLMTYKYEAMMREKITDSFVFC